MAGIPGARGQDHALKLSCPRCGLTLSVRSELIRVEHCPRCIARAHLVTVLVAGEPPGGDGGSPTRGHSLPRLGRRI